MRNLESATALMQDQSSKSTTAIRARVFDPARRLHTLWLGGAAAMVGGIALATVLPVWWIGYGTSMLGLVAVLAWEIRPRRRAADTMVTCMPGAIRTKQTGLIRARDIEGATTARIGERLALVLSHRRRRRAPIILELDDEPAADAIRKSLGVGHHGFGHIDFVPRPTSHETTSRVVTIMAILSALAMLIPEPMVIAMAAFMLVLMLSLVVSVAIVRHAVPSPFARLTAGGVFLPTGMFVPFNVIEDVKVLANEVLFQIRTDRGVTSLKMPIKTVTMQRVGTTREELEHIVAQIRAASDRCHGQYTIKSEPEALAARLARGKDENDIDWHARLDTIAMGGAGYRALSAEPAELWALLEDPEAAADVRAAAARVLRRIDKDTLRVRVKDVLATVRDKETRVRIADSIEEEEEHAPDSQSAAHS